MARGWLISPVIGTGIDEDPIRPQIQDAITPGTRLEYVIAPGRARALVAFDTPDVMPLLNAGGNILAEESQLDIAIGSMPTARRALLRSVADDEGVLRTGRSREIIRRIARRFPGFENFDETRHLTSGTPRPPGSFVDDSFTDTAGVILTSHVGETGATWTNHPESVLLDGIVISSTGTRINSSGQSGLKLMLASGTPASAEYDVAMEFFIAGATSRTAGVVARMDSTADTGYETTVTSNTGVWDFNKRVAGVVTSLGSYSGTFGVGDSQAGVTEIRDAAKKVFIQGVERISSTDNAITGAGRIGVRFQNTGSNVSGPHIAYITATDLSGGGVEHQGAFSVLFDTDFDFAGQRERRGAIEFDADSDFDFAGQRERRGAVPFQVDSSLNFGPTTRERRGGFSSQLDLTLLLSGNIEGGVIEHVGAFSAGIASVFNFAGIRERPGAFSTSIASDFDFAGQRERRGAIPFSASMMLGLAGQRTRRGTISFGSGFSLGLTGVRTRQGAISFTSELSLLLDGAVTSPLKPPAVGSSRDGRDVWASALETGPSATSTSGEGVNIRVVS